MAIKKAKQNVDVTTEEVVETGIEVEDTPVETVEEPEVEINVPEETDKLKEDDVTVDLNAFKFDEANIPEEKEKKVKIRMRVDHHCVIAMERYDLKAGKCYDVPKNVKDILNRAGLLSPL